MFVFIFNLQGFTVGDGAAAVTVEEIVRRHRSVEGKQHVQQIDGDAQTSLSVLPRSANRGQKMAINLVIELGARGDERIEPL